MLQWPHIFIEFDGVIRIITNLTAYIFSGQEVFEVLFVATVVGVNSTFDVGTVVSPVDLEANVAAIMNVIKEESLTTGQGKDFVAVNTSARAIVQQDALFGLTHNEIIQPSDMKNAEEAFSAAFRATMETSMHCTLCKNCMHSFFHLNYFQCMWLLFLQ